MMIILYLIPLLWEMQDCMEIMKEKEEIYAKEDFTDEDGMKASELEGEFASMNGWEAESDAATLLNGLGIETDLHYKYLRDFIRCRESQSASRSGFTWKP